MYGTDPFLSLRTFMLTVVCDRELHHSNDGIFMGPGSRKIVYSNWKGSHTMSSRAFPDNTDCCQTRKYSASDVFIKYSIVLMCGTLHIDLGEGKMKQECTRA